MILFLKKRIWWEWSPGHRSNFLQRKKNEIVWAITDTKGIINQIRKDQPFKDRIDYEHDNIERIIHEWARSWGVFCIKKNDNQTYKLRKCSSISEAEEIQTNSEEYENILPKFYWRDWPYLLYRRINKWTSWAINTNPEIWERFWGMLGQVNKKKDEDIKISKEDIFRKLYNHITTVRKEFSKEDQYKIRKILEDFKNNPNLRMWIDISDTQPGNIIFDPENKGYLIDEEAFVKWIQWLGIGKIMKHKVCTDIKWFMTAYEKESNIQLDENYLTGVFLIVILKKIAQKISVKWNDTFGQWPKYFNTEKEKWIILDIINNANNYISQTAFPDFLKYIQKNPTKQSE